MHMQNQLLNNLPHGHAAPFHATITPRPAAAATPETTGLSAAEIRQLILDLIG